MRDECGGVTSHTHLTNSKTQQHRTATRFGDELRRQGWRKSGIQLGEQMGSFLVRHSTQPNLRYTRQGQFFPAGEQQFRPLRGEQMGEHAHDGFIGAHKIGAVKAE
ncbi:MAG TPA: hypothetical protein VF313_03545 [Anaerolineaceae bacterium]